MNPYALNHSNRAWVLNLYKVALCTLLNLILGYFILNMYVVPPPNVHDRIV